MKKSEILTHLFLIGLVVLFISCQSDGPLPVMDHSLVMQIEDAQIQLISKEPEISTPTGVVVDEYNRIWVIENHTHVRQDDYQGPESDRILVFEGYLDQDSEMKVTEYATDFIDGMSLSLASDGKVLITTRASVTEFTDNDGDLVADSRRDLITLDTEERFPHNGMSGMVIGPDNKIYFQCGENFGSYYEISGTDGTTLIGKEREGGSIYRCDRDGSNLERIATAIWNCFAMTFDDYGNLFAVENDPDSRPPCRMLHIVKGGNYGFQFQHGRDGLSPLTSWFGEIPGTLPMVAGVGEAPSGVLHYGSDRLGSGTMGAMLVTAWGDNQIEQFQLKKKGSSFSSEMELLVKGGRDFYPVGLATDNNGGVIATDWASVSYAVHGQGRIWRITNPYNDEPIVGINYKPPTDKPGLIELLNSADVRVRAHAADDLVLNHATEIGDYFKDENLVDQGRMNILWAAQNNEYPAIVELLQSAITIDNELLRSASVRIMIDNNYENNEDYYLKLVLDDASPFVKREAIYGLQSEHSLEAIVHHFGKDDPFIHTAIVETFGKSENVEYLKSIAQSDNPRTRLGALLCLRNTGTVEARNVLPSFLTDESAAIRISALKWIAEEDLKEYRDAVTSSFASLTDVSSELFDTYMACFQYLDGVFDDDSHFMEGDVHVSQSFYKRQKFLVAAAKNENLNFDIRTRSLSAINPNHEELDLATLQKFMDEPNVKFQIEAIRSLGSRTSDDERLVFLQQIAFDSDRADMARQEAIVWLSASVAENSDSKNILVSLLENENTVPSIKDEATRSLDAIANDPDILPWIEAYEKSLPSEEMTASQDYWRARGQEEGNSLDGARTFFSERYQCSSCHRIDGRGGIFGPDLSKVGSNADRARIIESILNPNDIVTPVYTGYVVTTKEEDVIVGRLDKDLDSKRHLQMILANGERKAIPYDDIAEQTILPQSLMTANLHRKMSATEFRNLIQFLDDQK